jgi:crossover junction endodeoxyribonuclease RusA
MRLWRWRQSARHDDRPLRAVLARLALVADSGAGARVIRFDVPGVPAPKGSSRAMMIGGMARVVPSGSNKNRNNLRAWDRDVRIFAATARTQWLASLGFGGQDDGSPVFVDKPVHVTLNFRMLRPGGHWAKRGGLKASAPVFPQVKPDIDKLTRSTLDSMKGILYDEDSRIVELYVHKLYAATPEDAGASIIVAEMR